MNKQKITLGGGCFWCIDAILAPLKGVEEVVSGYAGGETPDPTYMEVCSGKTGHAEVVEVTFDADQISLHDLLSIFFTLHNPTTPNQQGADRGTQYRSIILYRDLEQKEVAQQVMQEIADSGIWEDPIITELVPLTEFYPAEDYHQSYFELNGNQPYCQVVIEPKVAKLRQMFQAKLKA